MVPGSAAPVSEDDDETELMDEQLLMMLGPAEGGALLRECPSGCKLPGYIRA